MRARPSVRQSVAILIFTEDPSRLIGARHMMMEGGAQRQQQPLQVDDTEIPRVGSNSSVSMAAATRARDSSNMSRWRLRLPADNSDDRTAQQVQAKTVTDLGWRL